MFPLLYYFLLFTSFLLILTVTLFMLSLRIPLAGFFARLLASYFCLVICASYGVIISILLRLVGYGRISQWAVARSFKYTMRYATGVTFEIDDPNDYLNSTRPAVFIGNHQTELDVLMLGCIFPKYCSVTAKSSLKSFPFLGWFMALSGTVFIDRKNSSSAREAMAGAADEIRERRQSVYMFPEGTRSYYQEPGLLPFKKGAFHLAVQAKVPIVPVVVANYSNVLSLKTWTFRSGVVPVKGTVSKINPLCGPSNEFIVLKPIDTSKLTASDVEDLARDVRELILKEHIAITAKARGQPIAMTPAKAPRQRDGVVKASGVEGRAS
jgi:lysophosphatidate acyltransferase